MIFSDRLDAELRILLKDLEEELENIARNVDGSVDSIDDLRHLIIAYSEFNEKADEFEQRTSNISDEINVLMKFRTTGNQKVYSLYERVQSLFNQLKKNSLEFSSTFE